MGIISLQEYLQQNGKEAVFSLLTSGNTKITEKINAHRVSFTKDKFGNISFFTKKKSFPIQTLDRIISDLYDPFINHILKFKEIIPQGTFSFYFTNKDIDFKYTKKHSSNIILTDCSISNDQNYLKEIATKINVDFQKTVCNRKLNETEASTIILYMESNKVLPVIMNELFGESATSLSEKPEDLIEGYVIEVNKKIFKLTDNRFVRKTYDRINISAYEMLLSDISEFVSNIDFTEISIDVKNKDFRYANFIFEVFNKYVAFYGESIENILISPPSFNNETGNLTKRYISNKVTLSYLKNEKYEYLLRVFLTTFRRHLDVRGILSEDFVKTHNALVDLIKEYVNNDKIVDFEMFKKFRNK